MISERRYDLDWLRVILILLVFLHHSAMPFNGDDWLIMNSESSKFLDDLMVYFEQWRLPLLFFISGAGVVFARKNRSSSQFLKERSKRLLIPFMVGIYIIVPPQIYMQNDQKYNHLFDVYKSILISPKTQHLWFIEYLFVFAILSTFVIYFLRSNFAQKILKICEDLCSKAFGFAFFSIILILIKIISKSFYPDDSHSILNLSSSLYYLFYFLMGLLVASKKSFWEHLKKHRKTNLRLAVITLLLFYGIYYFPSNFRAELSIKTQWNIWYAFSGLVSWITTITILGYSQILLNIKSKWLKYLNEAIYPFYILHQTVIVIIAYYVVQLPTNIFIKLLLVVVPSMVIIVLIYLLIIYPFKLSRFLFGMKGKLK
jgi:glucans biosynthesis protein C